MARALLTITLALATAACNQTSGTGSATRPVQTINQQQVTTMKIRITIDGTVLTATLAENATSRDFLSLLPLTLTLKDYAATEKISDLPRRLSTDGAPASMDPHTGDITYYAPWGNLAICQWTIVFFGSEHPRTHVNFIRRHRRMQRIALRALAEPVCVVPGMFKVPNDRCRARRLLVEKPKRIGLVYAVTVLIRDDVKLIDSSFAGSGNESFPNSGTALRLQRVGIVIPSIETADHVNVPGVGRPDAEYRTLHAL